MTQLQKIVAKAKSLKKSYPNTKWTDLIKKASKLVTPAKKSVSGINRKVVAKKSAPIKPLIKKRIESKSDFAMAGVKKKKATKKAVKKSTAKSYHKDTKSHNVRINVVSGYRSQPEVIVGSVGNIKKIQNFVPELKVRINRGKSVQNNKVTGSKSASDIFKKFIGKNKIETQEFFAIMYLTNNANVIGVYITSMGGITATVADKRLIIGTALQLGATSMIICHNHPSGNLNPSSADKNFTTALIRDAKEFEISVLDHIIITKDSYFSFSDNGII